jgi:hypothetical protein
MTAVGSYRVHPHFSAGKLSYSSLGEITPTIERIMPVLLPENHPLFIVDR